MFKGGGLYPREFRGPGTATFGGFQWDFMALTLSRFLGGQRSVEVEVVQQRSSPGKPGFFDNGNAGCGWDVVERLEPRKYRVPAASH